ncbi:MAG TPA: zf-HC2 domain-containing protein [Ktedonobacterales bacterium]|nr:zf-HC2 domain-containing protein [Ktedonobacterales bacterium]
MSDNETLDCAAVTPYLSPFADGELAEPLRSQVAAHIATCDDCAAQLERIRTIDQLIGSLPHTAPSAGVYERTLAAATRHASADPHSVTRERLAGGAELRRRLRQIVAPDQAPSQSDDDSDDLSASRVGGRAGRRRSPWVAAAIPAAAALLLVALAASLFNRFPSFPRQGATSHTTPNPASPLQQTASAINALADQLAFAPVSPTYLPAGASAPRSGVGPQEQVQKNSRYLDVTWTFASGPASSLRLRELPSGLGFDGYVAGNAAVAGPNVSTRLQWALPQTSGWQPLTPTDCATCLAVGQTRAGMQLALDARPRGGASADAVAVWLRMVSLSLDAPYKPLGVRLASPSSSDVLHYQATVSDGQGQTWQWTVSTLGALGQQQNAQAVGRGVNVTEIRNGSTGVRLDNSAQVFQNLSLPIPPAQPPHSVTQPLIATSDYLAAGELWNLGGGLFNLPDKRTINAYDLYWADAAQPEHIYVDATTGQAVALVVTPSSESKEHPGGLNGAQSFISTTACQPYIVTYTFIEYLPPSLDTATLFSLQPPPNYHPGVVQSAFTCQEQ